MKTTEVSPTVSNPLTVDGVTFYRPAWLLKEARRMAKDAGLSYEGHTIRIGERAALYVLAKDKAGWVSPLTQTL